MRKFFIVACFIATAFDGIAVMLGLCVAAKVKLIPGYVLSAVGALIIMALMVSVRDIWRRHDTLHRALRIFWFAAFLVNCATVILASANHIILERPISDSVNPDWNAVFTAAPMQLGTIVILTVFLSCSPIAASYLSKAFYEEDDDDDMERTPRRSKPTTAAN